MRTTFDVFRDAPAAARTRDWLAVGRLVGNKCQHEIVQTFGVYATAFDPEAHLHLIGDTSDRFYVAELHDLAQQMGVDGRVHLWGKIGQEELVERYRTSGLYLSLSEHEGFGVPLLEAMAAGLPVVAFGATAVPETMGGAGIQLHDKDPWFVAGAREDHRRRRWPARAHRRPPVSSASNSWRRSMSTPSSSGQSSRALGEKQPAPRAGPGTLRDLVQPGHASTASSHSRSIATTASRSRSTPPRAPATTHQSRRTCVDTREPLSSTKRRRPSRTRT